MCLNRIDGLCRWGLEDATCTNPDAPDDWMNMHIMTEGKIFSDLLLCYAIVSQEKPENIAAGQRDCKGFEQTA